MATTAPGAPDAAAEAPADPREPVEFLFRQLRAGPDGLTSREAARRLIAYGPNQLERHGGRRWPRQLASQLTHPLALLLWLAAALAFETGLRLVGAAILTVIVLNALFAFFQEQIGRASCRERVYVLV